MIDVNKIEEIFEEYPSHLTHKIKGDYEESYNYIKNNFEGDTFTEKIYQYAYGEDKSVCNLEGCNSECEFQKFGEGFTKYCSYECNGTAKESKVKNECEICGEEFITVPSRSRRFCSEECRREYFKTDECNRKRVESHKETMRKKHGGDFYFQTEEFKQKARKTTREKYGDENYRNVKKAKETKKKKYGDPNYNNMEKHLKTLNEKYTSVEDNEVKNISQTVEYKNRLIENQIEIIDVKLPNHIIRNFDGEDYRGVVGESGYIYYNFYCEKCGNDFQDFLDNGNIPLCPDCDKLDVGVSETEKEVCEYVNSILSDDVEAVDNDKSVLDQKELDIYIPEKQIAVEFNGLYWHSEASGGKDKFYHQEKTEECEDKGIHLIHIFEHEWRDKREIVKNRLKHILGCSDERTIYARKCSVSEISRERKTKFLEKYHIQGAGRSSVKLGLFYGDFFNSDLKAVMTFGTPSVAQGHKGDKNNFWEMKRFALSQRVVGGAGKLFKHFVRNYDVDKVITYADRRWSTKLSNVYEKIGFEYVGYSDPNYFYFHTDDETPQLQHRFAFRKNVLNEKLEDFDPELTEWENMQRHGYDRIWDSGNLKYVWERE